MLVTGLERLAKFLKDNAPARGPIARWVDLAQKAQWHSIVDARATFPTADAIKGTSYTCFNIGGNNYRLITAVSYSFQAIAIVELLTHEDYDRKYT
jgi:mRNA interferase HigB